MKIILAGEIFEPDIGGPATYLKELSGELAKDGYKTVVLCYSDKLDQSGEVIRILRGRSAFGRYFRYFWRLLKIYEKGDLVYAQGPVASGLPCLLLKKIKKASYFLRIGGDYSWEQAVNAGLANVSVDEFNADFSYKRLFNDHFLSSIKITLLRFIQSKTVQNAEKVIVASSYLKNLVEKFGRIPENILVIPSAFKSPADSDITKDITKEDAREKLGFSKNDKILLSIGRFVPWKGFETLIKIMPSLLERDRNFKLALVGDGPTFNKCAVLSKKILSEKMGREGAIILAGKKRHEELEMYYKAADAFILNSGYEGLSHNLVESLSSGLPTIASDIGGNREIIKDGINGLLFSYNDPEAIKQAVLKVFFDDSLAAALSKNASESSKKFEFLSSSYSKFKELMQSYPHA